MTGLAFKTPVAVLHGSEDSLAGHRAAFSDQGTKKSQVGMA